jgi:hypothetical protein
MQLTEFRNEIQEKRRFAEKYGPTEELPAETLAYHRWKNAASEGEHQINRQYLGAPNYRVKWARTLPRYNLADSAVIEKPLHFTVGGVDHNIDTREVDWSVTQDSKLMTAESVFSPVGYTHSTSFGQPVFRTGPPKRYG